MCHNNPFEILDITVNLCYIWGNFFRQFASLTANFLKNK